jgi:pilus assembly protein Flp/PilA
MVLLGVFARLLVRRRQSFGGTSAFPLGEPQKCPDVAEIDRQHSYSLRPGGIPIRRSSCYLLFALLLGEPDYLTYFSVSCTDPVLTLGTHNCQVSSRAELPAREKRSMLSSRTRAQSALARAVGYSMVALMVVQDRLEGAKKERGATAVEYGLLVGLIAIVIIVGVSALGGRLQAIFATLATKLGGTP